MEDEKMLEQNLETVVHIRADGKLRPEELNRLNEAWSRGDYRLWFEFGYDYYGKMTLEISARRYGKNAGVDITRQWREVRQQLAVGEVPDWLIEEALKNN